MKLSKSSIKARVWFAILGFFLSNLQLRAKVETVNYVGPDSTKIVYSTISNVLQIKVTVHI